MIQYKHLKIGTTAHGCHRKCISNKNFGVSSCITISYVTSALCECQEVLKNDHLYSCKILNVAILEVLPRYDAIFNGTQKQQKIIRNILLKNMAKIEKRRNFPRHQ